LTFGDRLGNQGPNPAGSALETPEERRHVEIAVVDCNRRRAVRGTPGQAQDAYPSRPIKIVVCLPAGGGVDTVTRIIADKLPKILGQPVVVENKGGQSGNLGAEFVYSSEPDGYTLLASQPAPITTSPLLFKKLNFDPTKFEPVAVMSAIANTLLVRPDFPANSVKEFIAYAKANPGKLNYASQGNGTTSHLTGAMFDAAVGTKMNHVPYRGTAPAINDLLGGHVDLMFNELATSVELHKGGRAKLLAVTTEKRIDELPDVPTMQEQGVPNFISDTWNAISAPPKTPAAIVAKLNAAINQALQDPEVKAHYARMHLTCGRRHASEHGQDRQGRHRPLGHGDQIR
jgi:tripartite-type tricarboxylate transporter receptor subunit TctC